MTVGPFTPPLLGFVLNHVIFHLHSHVYTAQLERRHLLALAAWHSQVLSQSACLWMQDHT